MAVTVSERLHFLQYHCFSASYDTASDAEEELSREISVILPQAVHVKH